MVRSSRMPLNYLFIWNRMLLFYINFGDRNPPYPALGSNIPSARRRGQRFHFLHCRGSSPSLRFVNRHGGTLRRAGWVAFTKTYSRGMCERKFYARRHGKITRQWKSTLTLITIVSALTLSIKKYFV